MVVVVGVSPGGCGVGVWACEVSFGWGVRRGLAFFWCLVFGW